MGRFRTKLKVESGGKYWILLQPLIFESERHGLITVPMGFKTDFASVPRIPVVYSMFGNTSHNAAVIHDWLYSGNVKISRKRADEVFIDAMRSKKQSKWRRIPMFWAVRLFAKFAFKGGTK